MTFRFCDETEFGFSWIAEDRTARTSHTLVDGDRLWVVDPVDWSDAIERTRGVGTPIAVVQLLDRHNRDCAKVASKLGVPHVVVPASLPRTPFVVAQVSRWRRWREIALWWPQAQTLVVAESVDTTPFFAPPGHRAGIHLLMRPWPPRHLARFEPRHLLVGHGEGVHGAEATEALRDALSRSRLDLPAALARLPRALSC